MNPAPIIAVTVTTRVRYEKRRVVIVRAFRVKLGYSCSPSGAWGEI